MNKKRKHLLTLSLAGASALTALLSVSAASLTSTTTTRQTSSSTRPIFERKDKETAKAAIAAGDYQAFLTAIASRPEEVPMITEAQFNVMVAAEKLRIAGDTVGAKKLLTEAGLKGLGKSSHMEMKNLTDTQKAIMEQSRILFDAGKKDEAKTLLSNAGIIVKPHAGYKGPMSEEMKVYLDSLTDPQKDILKQSRELMREGKKDEADALLVGAGIKLPKPEVVPVQ